MDRDRRVGLREARDQPAELELQQAGGAGQVNSIASIDRQLLLNNIADRSRTETVPGFMNPFIETGGTAGIQFANDRAE